MFGRAIAVGIVVLAAMGVGGGPAQAAGGPVSADAVGALAPCRGHEVQFWYERSDATEWTAFVKNCGRYSIRRRIDVSLLEDTPCKTVGPGATVSWYIQVHNPTLQKPVKEYAC